MGEELTMDQAAPALVATHVPTRAELFLGFLGIAIVAFGGVLPWARYVLVERRRWLTPDEFTDVLALGQLLPGPNIVNVSIAIGNRFHGALGSLIAFAGLMGAPIAIVLALAGLYARFAENPQVRGALVQVAAAAAGLVIAMALKLAVPLLRKRFATAAPIIALTFIGVAVLRWPLIVVVAAVAPVSIAAAFAWRRP
jgi:chromate transporter